MNKLLDVALAVFALVAIAVGTWHLESATDGLTVSRVMAGTTPVTVFRLQGATPAPVVVIAHGFAGSQQLMQPFAITLARNGYLAVTFDFLGHGENATPLGGSLTEEAGTTKALVDQLATVAAFAKTLPGSDGRLAVLGHSMGSDIVVRHAQAHSDVAATIAVSMFAPDVQPASPRDLLVIVGALEPGFLKDVARRATAMAASGPVAPRTTYGSFADGTARRYALSSDVEHIGVLYSRESLSEALGWLDAVFRHQGSGYLEVRGGWLGLLFLGLVLLARPLSRLLPPVSSRPLGAGLGWSRLLPVAIAPMILTPLILWKAPTGFLPILLGDYLAAHFLVYGLVTALGLRLTARRNPVARPPAATSLPRLAFGVAVVAFYSVIVIGVPIDRYVASFMPIPARAPLILALMIGTLPYFLADEWLVRGAGAPRGAYALTKLCFIVSLAIAVALNFMKLFFLVIIAFVILLFFVIYGLFSGWAYRATRSPLVGALANALAFAWAVAVTFPLLAR